MFDCEFQFRLCMFCRILTASFSNLDSNEDIDRDGQCDGAEDSGSGSWWRCVLQ